MDKHTGHRQPLIFQYVYHIKLATLRPCIKFQNCQPVQSFYWDTFDYFLL